MRCTAALLTTLLFACSGGGAADNDADTTSGPPSGATGDPGAGETTGSSGDSDAGGTTVTSGTTGSTGGVGSDDSGGEEVTQCDDAYPRGAVFASTVGPGYDPNNASAAFVNALTSAEEGSTVVVDFVDGSDGVWNIEEMYPSWFDGDSGEHQVADNVTVIFEAGVTLRALSDTYDDPSGLGMLFRLEDVSGWRIFGYGAAFEFDQAGLSDGEFRHSIALYDCRDIHVEGLTVDGSGGDGIVVSTRTPTGYSENISLKNMQFFNHRRQGTTLVSVSGFVAENVKFNATSYRPPNSGIDLEPNFETQRLTDITFTNTELADNDYTGLLFALSHQDGSSADYDITFNDTFIHDNWQTEGDEVNGYTRAAIVMGNAGGATEASCNQGQVTFNRLYIRDEEYSGLFTVKHGRSYQLNFNDWVIANVGNRNVEDDRYPIFTNRYTYGSAEPPQGRLGIDGLLVVEDRDVPFFRLAGSSSDAWSIDEMTIDNARVVTPHAGVGVDNVQGRPEGPGTSFEYAQSASMPRTTVTLSASVDVLARGSSTELMVTRSSEDIGYPLAVEYTVSGAAENFDDFDGLHGFVVIPANAATTAIPLSARDKCDERETVTITLVGTDVYDVGATGDATISLLAAAPQ